MAATAEQRPWGRIRLRRDQAVLLLRLLNQERDSVVQIRNDWKEIEGATLVGFNRATALIDATKEEIWRLMDEQGWDVGA